jgi:aspartyl-tRNA(Asn)/glutamyl-tRNA(Gln) amidotransferase subunit A
MTSQQTDTMTGDSLLAIAADVRCGRRSARAVAVEALASVERLDPALNAFVAIDRERTLHQADAIDETVARGEPVGPLAGVPLAVKDTEDTVGYRTTYGSLLWRDAPIAERDAVLVARLRAAGCVVIGKTNVPELAASAETDNLLFGVTRNPLDPSRTPGGSSGGSAAAVRAGMVPLATASDGGGSIRIPASACGLPGFKPSLGRIPDGGTRPVDWPALTTRGVLTRTMEELLAALDVIVGPDPTDLRSLPAPPEAWSTAVLRHPSPRRVAWSATLGYSAADPSIDAACRAAVNRLANQGVEIVEVDRVFDHEPYETWSTLILAYLHRSVAGRDRSLLTPELRGGIETADRLRAADLLAAEDACHELNLQLAGLFEGVDLLLTPTLHVDPPTIGDDRPWIRATGVFNLTRSPTGTIPVGLSDAGLPVGLQIVGPQHADLAVLALMRALERPELSDQTSALR